VRSKNAAFLDLDAALAQCEKRRHASGTIPETWRQRLAELRAVYRRAVLAWERGRARWTG
jgi:hypothetical protein